MKYKLLALDIDDTLVERIIGISDINRSAIFRAQQAGVYVTIATGRGYLGSTGVWRELNINGPIINYGGAIIMDTRTNKPIYETSVPNALVHEILSLADELGVYAQLYQGDTVITRTKCDIATYYTSSLKLPLIIDSDIDKKAWQNVPKVLFVVPVEREAAIIRDMQRHFEGRLKISASKPGFVEFNHIEAHKGAALLHVADILGIDRSETAAMGDNTLDYEMIQMAGLGAAVANAEKSVLAIAKVTAPSCKDNGVAWFIDNYIL